MRAKEVEQICPVGILPLGEPVEKISGLVGILSQPGRPPLPEGWDSQKGEKIMFILHFRLF